LFVVRIVRIVIVVGVVSVVRIVIVVIVVRIVYPVKCDVRRYFTGVSVVSVIIWNLSAIISVAKHQWYQRSFGC